ncbi:MAG: hypothetical protein LZ158_01995 [Thaumarchaeota archaeon]|jgi:hypothetical protein|nr:hypothetical protein [Candidatus Terraquivivens yellowstonensis]MCL7392907.1 hypothetical protein [Candidatus Terraquivivens yellowstonensis]MCL7397652.1 hypothetical protein [Candidatus Terraquivivens yellowstonensis]MCL7399054.1 hypothetical protein [Candidatus Terraquivivens yellowstonensis]MCL7400614.1 hypothetical protein [Candidatus Terraquivivens yellowstonensis]
MSNMKDKIFTVCMLAVFLLIVWGMFLCVLYLMSVFVIPLSMPYHEPLLISIYRIGVAFIVLIVWVIAWHRLAIFWLYRILRRSNRYGISRQNDSPS